MLGKYELLDVLGHGASGIVYLAKDTLLCRQVALKEVSAQGEDKDRFLGEARVLDRLHHPNIVQVIGVDEIDGKIIIAMEYVRGRSLLEILRATPQLPLGDAIGIAAQICEGLAFAHSQRTVHRDIKPANILVNSQGVVKLVDFGLAEVLGTHSLAGGAGTYAYMAPEDFHEEEHSDRRSDIWAVGVILYEILAGRRPFSVAKAKDPFAWKRVIEEDTPVPISKMRPDAPPEIDEIVNRALAKQKQDRYADASAMAADLRSLVTSSIQTVENTQERGKSNVDHSKFSIPEFGAENADYSNISMTEFREELEQQIASIEKLERQQEWASLSKPPSINDDAPTVAEQVARPGIPSADIAVLPSSPPDVTQLIESRRPRHRPALTCIYNVVAFLFLAAPI